MQLSFKSPYIIKYFRDENNNRVVERIHVNDFPPYFYINKTEDLPEDSRILRIENTSKKSLFGDELRKVVVREVYDVPRLRNLFSSAYEADIRFIDRYFIDKIKEIPNENLRKCYFDLETSDMPSTQMDNEAITCIGVYDNYTTKYYTFIISDKDTIEEREGHVIYHCINEYMVLDRFIDHVKEFDYDMLIAHNAARFDFPVLIGRIQRLSVMNYGRLSPIGVVKRDNSFGEWKTTIENRILFDFMGSKTNFGIKGGIRGLLDGRDITVKGADGEDRIVRIKRWSLEYLAQFVGMKKGEYSKIQSLEDMIKYNRQDIQIMVELDKFFNVTEYYHNMQKLIGCPYEATYFNTNMIDIFLMKRYNYFIFPSKPQREKGNNDITIKGATVDDPISGLYPKMYVIDQTSLYPTVVISANMSLETACEDGEIKLGNGISFTTKKKGIIADAVEFLLEIRLRYKELAKTEKDPHVAQMYGLISDGYKILLVSFYGALLFRGFRLYDYKIAESIPYMGRVIKEHVRDLCKKHGYTVVYGDSVTGDSIIPIKDIGGNISFQKIEDLFFTITSFDGEKECYLPNDIKTLTIDKTGEVLWNKINRVIRHRTNKKIYNVAVSNKWSVNVTEDHSLIGYANQTQLKYLKNNENFIETTPLEIGKKLNSIVSLKYIPRENIIDKQYPKQLYEFMGLFIGDGSFELQRNGGCTCISLSTGFDSQEICDKVLIPLQNLGYISRFYIRKNGFDIRIYGTIINIMQEFRSDRIKIIPNWIKDETFSNMSSFIRGMFESDGSISKRGNGYIITFTNIREDFINKLQELLWYIGIPSGICIERNTNKYNKINSGTYTSRLNIRNNINYKDSIGFISERKQLLLNNVVTGSRKKSIEQLPFDVVNHLKISEIKYDDYVYDIEVENIHTFFANGILVHNTDSSMIVPTETAIPIEQLIDIINLSFDGFSKGLGMPTHRFHIELDKVFSPIILSDVKKRYVGFLEKKGKRIFKSVGFESVRRDTAPITEQMQETIFKIVLAGGKKEDVMTYVNKIKEDIKNGEYKLRDLMLPKGFSKSFDKFKVDSPWVRGARYSNKNLGTSFDQFSDVGIFYIKYVPEGKPFTEVVAIDTETEHILEGFKIDWPTQIDKLIDHKVNNFITMMKWDDLKQKTLFEF